MPVQKDFKRLVRQRMRKTGESYTAARANLLQNRSRSAAPDRAADYARLAGMSDAAVEAKTGCTWAKWVFALDYSGAHEWPHREIARHVHERYGVPGWWAQMVTVGYERIKGLRAKGQRRDGGFEASRSRTFPVPVRRLYRAFRDRRVRARWLPAPDLEVRAATPDRSMRITWPDRTSVELWFMAKGDQKSSVQIQHRKLGSSGEASRMKAYWAERLDDLAAALQPAAARRGR